jgi:carboxylate-amine ligase
MRTVGVEEELLLVDPDTGRALAVAPTVLAAAENRVDASEEAVESDEQHSHDGRTGAGVEAELQLQQIEIDSTPCERLADLGDDLVRRRHQVDSSARDVGVRAVALGTSPLPVVPRTTPHARYRRMAQLFGLTEREQLTCGCHVHVSVGSDEEGVAVLDRIRVWLPVLVAMSANSPFWQGRETGYAGYRSQVWARWPSAGPVELHGSPDRYRELVASLMATGAVLDEGMVYFDARLSASYPTVEVRVPDVAQDVRHSVLLAGLTRALVDAAAADWQDGRPAPDVPAAVVRGATWRASRHGLRGDLFHPVSGELAPASRVVQDLVERLTHQLTENGDLALVGEGTDRLLDEGNGADQQRRVFGRHGRLEDVVRSAVDATRGPDPARPNVSPGVRRAPAGPRDRPAAPEEPLNPA